MTDWCRQAPEGVEPNVTFAELLREYIGESTLESIVDECRRRGVDIDRLYLGRLRSGDRLPPEDDMMVETLAEICGRDRAPLLLLARIERKPQEVIQAILAALAEGGHGADLRSLDELVSRVKGLRRLQRSEQLLSVEIKLGSQVVAGVDCLVPAGEHLRGR